MLDILAATTLSDGSSIRILEVVMNQSVSGVDYVRVQQGDEIRNLQLHYTVNRGESEAILDDLPYIIVHGEVIPISRFKSLGGGGRDITF